tara:strand:- start:6780 stop:7109 length:330 start_codon:yes stop_codon:yes gene_type:complete
MGRIHGSAYLIIGFFVSFISWIFDLRKLIVFFVVGLIMALYGGARMGFDIYEYYHERKNKKNQPMQQQTHPQQHSQVRSTTKHCKSCGTPNHLVSKFCHQCGHTNFHMM